MDRARRTRPRRRGAVVAVLLAAGAWLAGPGAAAAPAPPLAPAADAGVSLRDDRGIEHRFPSPPRRIVSLLPSLTEAVWVLGGGDRLVGVDRYSDWPTEVTRLPRLGGIDDTPIEALVALKPDVVLASTSARAIDRLEELGLRVLRLRSETHADVRRTLSLVARLLGTPEEGARAWAAIQRDIEAAAARVPPSLRGQSVYVEIGGGAWAAGRASFLGETLAALGLENIAPATMGAFPRLNPEFVVRARPAVIVATRRDLATMTDRPGWRSLPALQVQRVCGFEPAAHDILVRPGPRLGEAAGLLAGCLQRVGTRGTHR